MKGRTLAGALCLAAWVFLTAGAITVSAEPRRGGASEVPDHPRKLRFDEVRFAPPAWKGLRHELSNGVPVYVVEDDSLPLVDVVVAVRAGQFLEAPDQVGVADLTASLLRRGGAGQLSADALDEEVDFLALDLDAVGGSTRSGVRLNAPSWALPRALELLFDVLRRPRFEAERLASIQDNLRTGLAGRGDDPLAVLGREWGWLINGPDHYSSRLLTPPRLEALDRAALEAFHHRAWRPANLTVAVSGDVETDAVLALLERSFQGWEKGAPAPWPPPAPGPASPPGWYHVDMPSPQAKIAIGLPGPRVDAWDAEERFTYQVLREILGNRIGGALRAREGLSYRTAVSLEPGRFGPGEVQIFVETRPDQTMRAVEIVRQELERLRRQAVPSDELRFTRKSLVQVLPLLFDTSAEVAGYYAEDELIGRPHDYWFRYAERIEAVSASAVRRAARAVLDPKALRVLTVGPWAEVSTGADSKMMRSVRKLPRRDPLTLETVSPEDPAPSSGASLP